MLLRREILMGATMVGVLVSAPALACRAPKRKDRAGYTKSINGLFPAWWRRDYPAFRKFFVHPELDEPFSSRDIFSEYFYDETPHQLGTVMFNGASAVVQVITVQPGNAERGICSGYAKADLFLVKFFPGFDLPVVSEIRHLDVDLLAQGEWAPQQLKAASL